MSGYLLIGPCGSGKTTVGKVLMARGYKIIDSDIEPGLVIPYNTTGNTDFSDLPLTREWRWNETVLKILLKKAETEEVFICGGASNQEIFYKIFSIVFALYTPEELLIKRLQKREINRWNNDSPELSINLKWNRDMPNHSKENGLVLVNSLYDPLFIADNIESVIRRFKKGDLQKNRIFLNRRLAVGC